jgi:gas vesicle protein
LIDRIISRIISIATYLLISYNMIVQIYRGAYQIIHNLFLIDNMGKFKRGLFFGGVLGAVVTWMNMTVKGKEFRDKLIDQSADIYAEVKERAMASDIWEEMQKSDYVQMVREVVDKYAVENQLAQDTKKMITKLVNSQWNTLRGEKGKK